MSNYKTLPNSKISFELTIEEAALDKAKAAFIKRYQSEVSIKGFRKGHAPESAVVATVGQERLAYDALNQAVDKAYASFLQAENVQVISQPEVDIKDPTKTPMQVNFEVEVFPSVKVGDYKKIKAKMAKTKVEDQEIEDALQTICAQMEVAKEVKRAAKDGDLVEVDFAGLDKDGAVIPNTNGEKTKFRMGMGHFLPDLEAAFKGMKAGEEKKAVKVKFPKDYHSKDFAGNTIPFDIKMHAVNEIDPSQLTEEQIEQVTGKKQDLKSLKEQVRETITTNKSKSLEKDAMDAYTKELAKVVKAELPQSWIDREVSSRLNRLQQNPQYQKDPATFWQTMGKTETEFKKDLAKEGERDLLIFLGLSEIVKTENVELDKDEMGQAHHMAHQHLQNDSDHKSDAHHAEMEKATLNLKIDKFLRSAIMEQ